MAYKISIIGSGNMAYCLADNFDRAGHRIHQIYARNPSKSLALSGKYGAFRVDAIEKLDSDVDFIILAVNDASIIQVANQIPETKAVIVHCAGAVDIGPLSTDRHPFVGVLWPIQSISGPPFTNLINVPLCIEANRTVAEQVLQKLAESISNTVRVVDYPNRQKLHLAAVFINNFGNALFHIADQLLAESGEKLALFQPLMQETIRKAMAQSPEKAQTGPAKRNDEQTMENHLALLKNQPFLKEIYQSFSAYIRKEM